MIDEDGESPRGMKMREALGSAAASLPPRTPSVKAVAGRRTPSCLRHHELEGSTSAYFPVTSSLFFFLLILIQDNYIVSYGENVRHLVGARADERVVELVVDHALQRHVSIIDDDVNRG